jgi:hypothetical protein
LISRISGVSISLNRIWDGVFLQWIPFICVKKLKKND